MTVAVSVLETAPADENFELSQANQNLITVSETDSNTFTVTVNGELNSFTKDEDDIIAGQWIGLVVNTGEADITNVECDGIAFDETDVVEATAAGAGAGSFILWLDAASMSSDTFTLATDGKADTDITIIIT